jgi:beta-ureidopropionase
LSEMSSQFHDEWSAVPGRFFIDNCVDYGVARRNLVFGPATLTTGCSPMVLVTTPPQPASNARLMFDSLSVGGAEASRNGFSNRRPVNVTDKSVAIGVPLRVTIIPAMPRTVLGGLIQAATPLTDPATPIDKIREAAIDIHLPLIDEAGKKGVQILGLQEIFNGPYFCPSQDAHWYDIAEPVPGPTTNLIAERAKKYGMAVVVPVYEREQAGVYYNTAAVYDHDGTYLGKYRKNHIPHTSGFWEKYFFKPGNLGYPVFKTRFATIGVYICYDRHFPEGARLLGLNGAEIVFNPSATVAGLSQYLWKLEQPAHAVANGYFMACSNRVGTEAPWNIGRFYGSSYFVDPRGSFLATGSEDKTELVVAQMDLDMIEEVRRVWQFYRDRRPDSYGAMAEQLP